MMAHRYDRYGDRLDDEDQADAEDQAGGALATVLPFRSVRRGVGWAAYREARRRLREYNAVTYPKPW